MGKVPSRVKFDEDGFPIPQTMQADTVQFDEDGLPIPVKKKAVGTDLSMVGGKAVPNGGQVGSSNPQLEKDKVLEYLKIGKPAITVTAPSVKEAESVSTLLKNKGIPESKGAVVETKIKKNESPFDQTKDEAFLAANEKLNEVMYGEGDEWLDPIKANITKAQNSSNVKDAMANIGANNIVEMSLAPSGYYADKILKNSIWSQATGGNLTANMLRQKAEDYQKRTSAFQEIKKAPNDTGDGSGNPEFYKYVYGQQIDNAAIKSYAEKNPNFKEQLQASGIDINDPYLADRIGSAKAGQIISESIFDTEVIEYAKHEAPWLLPALKVKANTLINDYKDFGINHVANKVSRAIQESGYNNIDPIFNFANDNMKEFARSTAKLELTPEEYDIYEKNILGNEEKYLDTPSFFEGFAGAGKSMLSGIKNTLTTPFKSIPEKIREGWEKEATNVSADPKGLMKVIRDSGHAVGIVSSLAAMGNVLGGGGTGFYSTKVVPALSGAIPFMGDFIEEGTMKYPNNPVKAWTSALFNTAMYSALSYKIFPVKDVQNAFKNIKPEVAEIVENLASGKITREVARREMSTLAKKGFDLLTGSVAKSAKISAELTGITALNSMLDKVMGMDGQTFEKYHPEGEEADAFTSLFLSNLVVGGMAKFGEMKRGNRIVEQSLYSAASNPKRFQDIIDKLEVKDPTINKQEMLDNLTYLTQVKDGLDKAGVNPKNQARYLFEAMKEKVQADAIKSTPDANITRMGEAKISESRKIKDRILQGEDVVLEEQAELAKEISKDAETTEQILNKAVEDGYIEGTYADMVMQGKGEEMLKEISQQAQNITSDGQPHNPELADIARKSAEQQVGKKIVALAIEKYPIESFKKGEPEQISQPIELDPTLPEGYELPEQQQQETEVNIPELKEDWSKDVESTAKALKIEDDKGEEALIRSGAFSATPKSFFEKYRGNKNPSVPIADAYHDAKKNNNNPELVKAVEDLLGKPKETTPTPQTGKGESIEDKKADIERRRQEELNQQTDAGYSTIALDYLFTGGRDVIQSTDYLLQALVGGFTSAAKEINDIRNKYANKLGNIRDDINSDVYNQMMGEIRNVISKTYNDSKANEIFDKILKNATGFTNREGNQISIELDKLNEQNESKINAKYGAELAELEKQLQQNRDELSLIENPTEGDREYHNEVEQEIRQKHKEALAKIEQLKEVGKPEEISQPIELDPTLPEGYELPGQPKVEAGSVGLKQTNNSGSKYDSFDIIVSGDKVGVIDIDKGDTNSVHIIDISPEFQGKGVAGIVYEQLAEKYGELSSSKPEYMEDNSIKVWDKLVRKGVAVKNVDGSYTIKLTEQSIKEQPKSDIEAKKQALETEKQQAITEATKPVVELELLGDENEAMDLILDKAKGDKDGGRAKVRQHERIRAKFQALKELIDCV